MSRMAHAAIAAVLLAGTSCSGMIGGGNSDPLGNSAPGPGGGPSNPGSGGAPVPGNPGPGNPPGGSSPPGPGPGPSQPPPTNRQCATLVPLSVSRFADLPAGPGVSVRVRIVQNDVAEKAVPAGLWAWTVSYGDGAGTRVEVTAIDPTLTTVQIPLERAGVYRISASGRLAAAMDQVCTVMEVGLARELAGRLGHFRVRMTPPSGSMFPVQEQPLTAVAGQEQMRDLALLRGDPVSLEPSLATGTGSAPSYVRITQNMQRVGAGAPPPLTFEGHTGRGAFRQHLVGGETYDLLVVPDGNVAPVLFPRRTTAALSVLELRLTPGAALSGKLTDPMGQPVADARVVLRAGVLTSTVGTSDGSGGFSLRAREARYALTVAPPPGSGLTEIALPETEAGAILVGGGDSAGSLDVTWAAVPTAAISLVVRTSDGLTPARGARVRLEREQPVADAATIVRRSGTAVTMKAPGLARATALAGADGAVAFPSLPQGRYLVVVTPADNDPVSAVTGTTVDLGPGGVPARELRLSPHVRYVGTVSPAEVMAGTRIVARPRGGDVSLPAVSATVGNAGRYELELDPGATYLISAEPPAGAPFARAQLAVVTTGPSGGEIPERAVPRALMLNGSVRGDRATDFLPGVVVQVFCESASPGCLDSSVPVAETVSTAAGQFRVALPDPGS
jgi:hypothetical protein